MERKPVQTKGKEHVKAEDWRSPVCSLDHNNAAQPEWGCAGRRRDGNEKEPTEGLCACMRGTRRLGTIARFEAGK